jgi:hypothetical protein
MAYCTTTDVYLEAGTAVGTVTITDIGNMITRSDAEITDILTQKGLSAPASATQLKTSSICLNIAKIKRRQAHELSRPNSLNLGGDISFSTSVEEEAKALEKKAADAIDQYIGYANGSGIRVSRVRTTVCRSCQ